MHNLKRFWNATNGKKHSVGLGALMILLLLVSILPACSSKPASSEIVLGALVAKTGSFSSFGESTAIALDLAVNDVNLYLTSTGAQKRVRLIVEDTATDPGQALEKLKSLAQQKVKFVIGPQTSAEASGVKDYANSNNIALVTLGTAPALAISGDNIYRLVPDDSHQAYATAELMWDRKVKAIVPFWRGDTWGDGLQKGIVEHFQKLGGKVIEGVRYEPSVSDFSTSVSQLSAKVNQTRLEYGNNVAVALICFSEVSAIFEAAQHDSQLSSVQWFGSDGISLSKDLLLESTAKFAATVGLPCPIFSITGDKQKSGQVAQRIENQLHRVPDNYALVAYDALWVVTLANLTSDNSNFGNLKNAFVGTADRYSGVTGITALNEAGDRKFWSYDFWSVKNEQGAFQWVKIGGYSAEQDLSTGVYYSN